MISKTCATCNSRSYRETWKLWECAHVKGKAPIIDGYPYRPSWCPKKEKE